MRAAEEARGDVLGRAALLLDEKLHRVDAFELEEPQSVHDLLLLNTIPIPCIVTMSEEHRFHVLPGHMVV